MKSYIFIMKYKTNSQCSFEFECLTWLLVLAQSQSLLFISAICYLVTKKSLAKPLSPSAHTNIQTHPQSQRLDTPECLILSGIALFRAFRCDVNFWVIYSDKKRLSNQSPYVSVLIAVHVMPNIHKTQQGNRQMWITMWMQQSAISS